MNCPVNTKKYFRLTNIWAVPYHGWFQVRQPPLS